MRNGVKETRYIINAPSLEDAMEVVENELHLDKKKIRMSKKWVVVEEK